MASDEPCVAEGLCVAMCLVGVVLVVWGSSSDTRNVAYGFAVIGAAAVGAVVASCRCRTAAREDDTVLARSYNEGAGRGEGGADPLVRPETLWGDV